MEQEISNTLHGIHNILVVEDNPVDAKVLSREIKKLVDVAPEFSYSASIKDLSAFENKTFDVIFLDLGLPDSKGKATLKTVKEKFSNAPVVVVSGSKDITYFKYAQKKGIQNYLVKGKYNHHKLLHALMETVKGFKPSKKILEEKNRNDIIFRALNMATLDWDIKSGNAHFNSHWKTLLKLTNNFPKHIKDFFNRIEPESKRSFGKSLSQFFNGMESVIQEKVLIMDEGGGENWLHFSGSLIRDTMGNPSRLVVGVQPIFLRQYYADENMYLLEKDPLTNIMGRKGFESKILNFKKQLSEGQISGFTLLLMDIRNFARINREWGAEFGNNILRGCARQVKKMCPNDGEVSRLGNDEFGLIFPKFSTEIELQDFIKALKQSMKGPYKHGKESLSIDVSSFYLSYGHNEEKSPGEPGDLIEQLFSQMRRLHNSGESKINGDNSNDFKNKSQLALYLEFLTALERGEWKCQYEPIRNLNEGSELELLTKLNWKNPDLKEFVSKHLVCRTQYQDLQKLYLKKKFEKIFMEFKYLLREGSSIQKLHIPVDVSLWNSCAFEKEFIQLLETSELPKYKLTLCFENLTEETLIQLIKNSRLPSMLALGVNIKDHKLLAKLEKHISPAYVVLDLDVLEDWKLNEGTIPKRLPEFSNWNGIPKYIVAGLRQNYQLKTLLHFSITQTSGPLFGQAKGIRNFIQKDFKLA